MPPPPDDRKGRPRPSGQAGRPGGRSKAGAAKSGPRPAAKAAGRPGRPSKGAPAKGRRPRVEAEDRSTGRGRRPQGVEGEDRSTGRGRRPQGAEAVERDHRPARSGRPAGNGPKPRGRTRPTAAQARAADPRRPADRGPSRPRREGPPIVLSAPEPWEPEVWVDEGSVREAATGAVERGSARPRRRPERPLPEDVREELEAQ